MRVTPILSLLAALAVGAVALLASAPPDAVSAAPSPSEVVVVPADKETAPVNLAGDAADDPAVWVHPTTPADSLVIGSDKKGALEVYDLNGTRIQRIMTATSFWGNVDVRQDVTIGGRTLDVVVAYNAGLRTFRVDPVTRRLEPVGDDSGAVPTSGGEGLCAYQSAQTNDLYVFVIKRTGRVRQYRIHDSDRDGLLQGSLVREFVVGSEAEGCVADDGSGRLYVSEEDTGLWRYGAEPTAGSARVLVDNVGPSGNLVFDVEGVTLAEIGVGSGYLIVSAQNVSRPRQSYFAVYDRQTNAYLSSFRIGAGANADGCERTDGISAHFGDLGPDFPQGLFVCQDNGNSSPAPGNQNFKMTRLERVLPGDAGAGGTP
jgi:myo-inositol-hexaphosphate 3-phosphohydrolase